MVHKKAKNPRAMAASFEAPEIGSVSSRTASLVPRPLMDIGIIFTIPINALQAIIKPKLTGIFNEIASKKRTKDLNNPIKIEITRIKEKNLKSKFDQNLAIWASKFRPI